MELRIRDPGQVIEPKSATTPTPEPTGNDGTTADAPAGTSQH